MMAKEKDTLLLTKYFNAGWLIKRYYTGKEFTQPYSAEDRLRTGKILYHDFLSWQRGTRLTRDYSAPKIDASLNLCGNINLSRSAERFRNAIKHISKASLPVVYQIVLNEQRILLPPGLSKREQLYFSDEIKILLCRGLDELCNFYKNKT